MKLTPAARGECLGGVSATRKNPQKVGLLGAENNELPLDLISRGFGDVLG